MSGDCFVVTADFVNLDLGGFTIESMSMTGYAITDLGTAHEGTVVRNGRIRRFTQALDLAESTLAVAADLTLEGQSESGGSATLSLGKDCRVERVHLASIDPHIFTFAGILIGDGCIVADNTIDSGSTHIGITQGSGLGSGSIIERNLVSIPFEDGINIGGAVGALIAANTVVAKDLIIQSGAGNLVIGNTVTGPDISAATTGIGTEASTLTTANTVFSCQYGITALNGMNYVSENEIDATGVWGIAETGQGSRFSNNGLFATGNDGMLFVAPHSIADKNSILSNQQTATNCTSAPKSAIRDNQARHIAGSTPFDSCVDLGGNVVLP
jgi:hypothetical protein